MASAEAGIEPTSDEIQDQMRDTRTRLSDQAGALEDKVMGYAQDTADAVAATIQGAKDTAQASVDAVRDSFESARHMAEGAVTSVKHVLDVRGHVRRNPWLLLGGAILLGLALGTWLHRPRR